MINNSGRHQNGVVEHLCLTAAPIYVSRLSSVSDSSLDTCLINVLLPLLYPSY